MVLKKRSSVSVQEEGPKKRRKEAVKEEHVDVKKKSKKSKEYALKVEEDRLSEEEYDEPDEEEEHEEDDELEDDMEMKEENNEIGWPQADMIELFSKIESSLPNDDTLHHATRADRLDWGEIAFNNYSPAECKRVWVEIHKRIRKFRTLKEVIVDARTWVHKPWTSFYKAAKKNVHPDMPRRPLTQYMIYYLEKKDKVAAQNPDLDMTQLSKIVSKMYQALPASKKEKYMRKATELREEYREKMRIFHEQHPEYENELAKAGLKKSHPSRSNLPAGLQKPRSAQQRFIDDRLTKLKDEPNFDKNEVTAKAKLQWHNLSDKKRLVWINWALEEENKYLEKLKLYQAGNPNFELPAFKTVLKKEELALRDRAAGKPAKPANSAYSLYSRIMLAKCPDLKELVPKTRMKEISIRWKEMPDDEKEEYAKKVKYEQERYKLEYATYLESLPEEERQEELMKNQIKKKKDVKEVEPKKVKEINNGKKANKSKSKKSSKKGSGDSIKKAERQYFPGEPHQPPVNAYELFVDSFVTDTKLAATEAPRFWEMLPSSDKSKFQRKLKELKEKYIKDYKKFLKSLDEDQVAKYNDLQKRNKEREAAAEAQKVLNSDDESDEDSSSEEETHEVVNNLKKEINEESDSDEVEENKKSDSSSDSSSSSGESSSSSSSSDDSDSSSDDSDDEDKTTPQVAIKKENSDSDSSDDE